MESPHYVVHQNNGGDFVVERTDPMSEVARAVMGGAGAALLWHGLRRPGVLAALSVLAGVELCSRAYKGKSMVQLLGCGGVGKGAVSSKENRADVVETASMESFPASDAPAMHGEDSKHARSNPLKGDRHVDGE